MKNVFYLLIFLFVLFILPSHITALSPTSSAGLKSPTPKKSEPDLINDLKDRLASKVAQLKLVKRSGLIGVVTDISNTQITLEDVQKNIRFVDVDELTKFSSPSAKESFGISDITKGTQIGVLGLYNKQSKRLFARFISVARVPEIIFGTIMVKNEKDFNIQMLSNENKQFIIEVEKTTKTQSYSKEGETEKSGFSKIKENDYVMVAGYANPKDKNKIIADRILVFSDIISSLKNPLPLDINKSSTGSGKTTPAK